LSSFVPHARTLRKARTQVNSMVFDGLAAKRIKNYLHRWARWWLQTAGIWKYDDLMLWFIAACWKNNAATNIGIELLMAHDLRLREPLFNCRSWGNINLGSSQSSDNLS
jgi:hypothetical protein